MIKTSWTIYLCSLILCNVIMLSHAINAHAQSRPLILTVDEASSAQIQQVAARNVEQRLMTVTAYCPCRKCCGPRACGITASGLKVTANRGCFVAADRSLPFGSLVSVPGYSYGSFVPVLDRGAAIQGDCLDVFFPTHEEALKWGRKSITVLIVRAREAEVK